MKNKTATMERLLVVQQQGVVCTTKVVDDEERQRGTFGSKRRNESGIKVLTGTERF